MRYVITGANGQLGTELTELMTAQQMNFQAFGSHDLDITDRQRVLDCMQNVHPDVIFHCAAYTAVDLAEGSGRDRNWQVNAEGTRNVAVAAATVGATMVDISTDYIFDGTRTAEYQVSDIPNPQTEYGQAKLAGEQAVMAATARHYIIRTSWVFGAYGKNFVTTMLRLAQTHSTLTVVNDQVGRPTWTKTLATFMLYVVSEKVPFGIYQLSNAGTCTWYEFAREILQDTSTVVQPVTSTEYPQVAPRPRHAVMSLAKARSTGFVMPDWHEALAEFMVDC